MQRVMHIRPRIFFAVVGELGAVHFWIIPSPVEGVRDCAGIEEHRRSGEGEPDHENCFLLRGPCWHDGSSLYAEAKYVPLFNHCNEGGDFEPLWQELEAEYQRRFIETGRPGA